MKSFLDFQPNQDGTYTLPPGIYFDLPEHIYHADTALGSTSIKDLASKPCKWQYDRLRPRKEIEPEFLVWGHAWHCRVLEGKAAFEERYAKPPTPADYPDALNTTDQIKDFLRQNGQKLTGNKPEPRQQRAEKRTTGQQERRQEHTTQAKETQETRQETKPLSLPELPDLMLSKQDQPVALEAAEKILSIALDTALDAPGRRQALKAAALNWNGVDEHLRPLVKAFIDATDWAIRKVFANEPWAADHAVFVHKVKTLLEVEKLNIGKYP